MKTLLLALLVLVLPCLSAPAADAAAKSGKLLHVVSFKFKPGATPQQITQIVDAFRDLKKKVPSIQQLEWGTNVSSEKHDKGFTHGFILSFKSEADRDAYLVHPEHKAFGKLLGPILDDVFVIDYWAQH